MNRALHFVVTVFLFLVSPPEPGAVRLICEGLTGVTILHVVIGRGNFLRSMTTPIGWLFFSASGGASWGLPVMVACAIAAAVLMLDVGFGSTPE